MTGRPPTGRGRGPSLTRRGLLSAGGLSLLAGAAACSRSASASLAAPQLPRGEPILVGASLELTGTGAIVGQAQRKALTIALRNLNSNGVVVGNTVRKINLDLRDSGSDPAVAAKQAQALLTERRAVALLGGGTAGTSMAMAPVAEKQSAPMLSTAAADSIIDSPSILERRFVFKLGPSATDVAQRVVDLIAPGQRVGLLCENSEHGTDGQVQLQQALAVAGLPAAIADVVEIGADSYSTPAARMAARVPDIVVIWAVSPTSGLVAQALRRAGFNGTIVFDSGAASEDSLSSANRSVAGEDLTTRRVLLITPRIMGGIQIAATTPEAFAQKAFVDEYTRLYGAFSGLAVYAADALNLVAAAIGRAGGTTRLRIRDELEATPYDGIAGEYLFSTISHGGVDSDALAVFQMSRGLGWVDAN